MSEPLDKHFRRLTADSELLRTIATVRADSGLRLALGDSPLRPVCQARDRTDRVARDWSRVRVADGFNPRGPVIAVATAGDEAVARKVNDVIFVPDIPDELQPRWR